MTASIHRPAVRKGELTRLAILGSAIEVAAREGLEGLTIGGLAERLAMSKSGVFAHFGSREELQIAVLRQYEQRFIDKVLLPAVRSPRGIPRLLALMANWLALTEAQDADGCLWIAGASEYDGRPGAVRDELVRMIKAWQGELAKAIGLAQTEGHLQADLDLYELQFCLYGVILALHHDSRLMFSTRSAQVARKRFHRILKELATPEGLLQFENDALPSQKKQPDR
jgi:AcrR family transcriptional regulator